MQKAKLLSRRPDKRLSVVLSSADHLRLKYFAAKQGQSMRRVVTDFVDSLPPLPPSFLK